MMNAHEIACNNIDKMLELLKTDQCFDLKLVGWDEGQPVELSLFFADAIGIFEEALKEMREQHAAEIK